MPNERTAVSMWIENTVPIPSDLCPVSHNPEPGSRLRIRYRVRERVLEVYSLTRYLKSFKGGHPDGTRNMETMIQKVAQDCADVLGCPVTVTAELELMPVQRMKVICRGEPGELLPGDASGGLARTVDGAVVRVEATAGDEEEPAPGEL